MNFSDAVFEQVKLDREEYFFFDLYFVIGVFEELFHYFKMGVWDEDSDRDLENIIKIASFCQLAAEKVLNVEEQDDDLINTLKMERDKYKNIIKSIVNYIHKNATEGSTIQKGKQKRIKVEFTEDVLKELLELSNG
jgi:hypothetical protein